MSAKGKQRYVAPWEYFHAWKLQRSKLNEVGVKLEAGIPLSAADQNFLRHLGPGLQKAADDPKNAGRHLGLKAPPKRPIEWSRDREIAVDYVLRRRQDGLFVGFEEMKAKDAEAELAGRWPTTVTSKKKKGNAETIRSVVRPHRAWAEKAVDWLMTVRDLDSGVFDRLMERREDWRKQPRIAKADPKAILEGREDWRKITKARK